MSTFVYMTRCDGCGHCVDICPSDIMHIDENIRRAKNIEPNFCWECYSCVKACPNHAIDVRGYADFAPMGHSVRVRREEEKGTISWKIKFRNGTEKNFVSPITTKPWFRCDWRYKVFFSSISKFNFPRNSSFFFFSSYSNTMSHWSKICISSNINSVVRTSFDTRITFPTKVRFNIFCTSNVFIDMHYIWWANIYAMTTAITSCHINKCWHIILSPFLILS